MRNETDNLETPADMQAEALLQQLLHLKQFERPDPSRMIRNKQNIMRQVREAQSHKRKSIGDLIEINMPWFFAEPKYGIAAVFVAFVALQYIGISSQSSSQSTGIYTTHNSMAALEQEPAANISPAAVAKLDEVQEELPSSPISSYPTLPNNFQLFEAQKGASDVRFVERLEPVK